MDYEYDVAISFAGEDRQIADNITKQLKQQGIRVFYDLHEQASLWGEDLYVHLHEVYSSKARYCVMLLSKYYAKKTWTNHERQSAQERAFREQKTYILPVRLDDTVIPGIRGTVGYIDLKNTPIEDLVILILKKLGRDIKSDNTLSNKQKIILPTVKKEITDRDKDRFLLDTFQSLIEYFEQGISELNNLDGFEGEFRQINAAKFLCLIYQNGKRKSECTIWYDAGGFGSNSIKYISKADPNAGASTNEILSIDFSEGLLGFKPIMRMDGHRNEILNAQSAIEYLWTKLINRQI